MNPPHLEALVPAHVRRFEPYVPSKPDDQLKILYGCQTLHRLNNNENPLGPPPAAAEVIRSFPPERAALYPSGDCYPLRDALAAKFSLSPEQFVVGNGANEAIAFVVHTFCEAGDSIVTADRTFAVYEWVSQFSGVNRVLVPLRQFGFDPEALLDAVGDRTKVFFICNPNNPTGTYWNRDTVRAFLDRVDGKQMVVLDEAYREFVDVPDFPDGISLLQDYPNVIVFRTFSKMYGLAGLRIGYLVAREAVTAMIRRTGIVYSVNAVAQKAARAALTDEAHVCRTRDLVAGSRAAVVAGLRDLGLDCVAGQGNFVMVRLPMSDSLAYRRLMQKGYMVRTMTAFRFPNWIRVSLHRPEIMAGFLEALAGVLPAGPGR
jgi:histidinol-phosphate aminotransferase